MAIFNKFNQILFDSHCHLNGEMFDEERDQIVQRSIENGVRAILDVSVDIKSSRKSIELSKKYKDIVYSWIGIVPELFIPESPFLKDSSTDDQWFETQHKILHNIVESNPKEVIGIGETGIDNFWLQMNKEKITTEDSEKSLKLQEQLFRMHLDLAQEFKLPLSIHSRGAEEKCLEIVKEYDAKGIFHSYTGNYETAVKILDAGYGLGVNGIITFKKAEELRAVYRKILGKIPTDASPEFFYEKGIYFETDAPFLSPEGKRGQQNEPGNIRIIKELFIKGF